MLLIMSDMLQITTGGRAGDATRRAFLQGVAILIVLVPLATYLGYQIALGAGAAIPEAAAGLTLALCTIGCITILSGLFHRDSYPHPRLGLCNVITLFRGAGIAVMAGLVLTPVATFGWWLAILALALLLLDGLDGWAARRAGLQSPFGARFDVETDVAFALTLAALAVALGQVGTWFLLLGLLRPLFVTAGHFWPALRAPLPEARWRKRMAGLQMGIQVVLVSPLLAAPVATWVGAMLLGAMLLSFAIDLRWLVRQAQDR